MENKYKGLNKKPAKEVAEILGKVEKYNYLAHSIREIELAILRIKGENYHIMPRIAGPGTKISKVLFFNRGCEILLPFETEDIDDRLIRLILAHELGHIVYNIENLKSPELLEGIKASSEEELFSWEFAYHIIKMKSDEHKSDIGRKRHIYDDDDLKKTLSVTVKTKKPEIYEAIVKSLDLPRFN